MPEADSVGEIYQGNKWIEDLLAPCCEWENRFLYTGDFVEFKDGMMGKVKGFYTKVIHNSLLQSW